VTGPVQVLVVGFDRLTFSGEVMTELDRLREAGTARLLDVLLVERGEDGTTWSLADAIPPGTSAAVALIEHLWATPLREAIARAGGTALEETWLHREDSERLDEFMRSG
jgi:hypothetical protein